MALDAPLNERQVEVLRWISDGCPDGRWTDFSFKTTANALASRRLVTVSKRGGGWSAAVLPAGEHYLAHERYPEGHWSKRRTQQVDLDASRRRMATTKMPVAEPLDGAAPVGPAKQKAHSPARDLVAEVIAAGGELRRESKQGPTAFSSLVAAVNRHRLAPPDKQLTLDTDGGWNKVVIRLEDAPYWLTRPAPEVVNAERIGRWHPALEALRDHEFTSMSAPQERRMLRILQALAVEAEARGHRVEAMSPRRRYHHRQSEAGHVLIRIREYRHTLAVWQKYREVPPPQWGQPVKRPDPGVLDSLAVGLIWESGSRTGIGESWSDAPGKRIKVEGLLPTILWELERRCDGADRRREQQRLAAIEREKLEAEAERQALIVHAENVRAEALQSQHGKWRDANQLREYLDAMENHIDTITDDDERTEAAAWLQWCRRYADTTVDPLGQRLALPTIREWTSEERNRLVKALFQELQRIGQRSVI